MVLHTIGAGRVDLAMEVGSAHAGTLITPGSQFQTGDLGLTTNVESRLNHEP
jgi:hypothetical protein